MAGTASISIRYGIMVFIMITAFFTVQAEANNMKRTLHQNRMEEVGQYTYDELTQSLKLMNGYNTTIQKKLHLPLLEHGYKLSLNCRNNKTIINVSANRPAESSVIPTQIKCGGENYVNVSGKVYPGERCITLEKTDETTINARVVRDCGA